MEGRSINNSRTRSGGTCLYSQHWADKEQELEVKASLSTMGR